MHVRSCCLANINLCFFTFLVAVAVVIAKAADYDYIFEYML